MSRKRWTTVRSKPTGRARHIVSRLFVAFNVLAALRMASAVVATGTPANAAGDAWASSGAALGAAVDCAVIGLLWAVGAAILGIVVLMLPAATTPAATADAPHAQPDSRAAARTYQSAWSATPIPARRGPVRRPRPTGAYAPGDPPRDTDARRVAPARSRRALSLRTGTSAG